VKGPRPRLAQRSVSIGTWLIGIFVLVVVLAAASIQSAMQYQEEVSLRAMAEVQARRSSELVFQNLYSVMSRGWTRQDMLDIIDRMNAVEPTVSIGVYRGREVAEQFGDLPDSRQARQDDPAVRQAFATGRNVLSRDDEGVRFVYPLIADKTCGGCHVVGGVGTVNGVIDMRFPVGELRVPLRFSLRLALYGLMATLGVLFLVIFLQMRLLIVRPIITLADVMRGIMDSGDLGRRLVPGRLWPRELRQLASNFNSLMREVEESRAALVERSLRDPLTGLFNRRQFDAVLRREVERAARYGRPLSVLAADLDGFKPVNDDFGHAAGDRVLVHIAHLMRANVRGTDVAARIGGDEFVILMPETTHAQAIEARDKIQAAILDQPVRWNDGDLIVGISIGIASTEEVGCAAASLMAAADAAMYAEKGARTGGEPRRAAAGR
jgi:diguanylate cyclase (GGDEF)-like protein